MKILKHEGYQGMWLRFCEVVFYLYTLIFIVKECRNVKRTGVREYYKQFWSWVIHTFIKTHKNKYITHIKRKTRTVNKKQSTKMQ